MAINDILRHMEMMGTTEVPIESDSGLSETERKYAERVFFEKYLKDLNPGIGAEAIERRVNKSIEIARILHRALNKADGK